MAVLDAVWNAELTASEIAQLTGLSRTAVEAVLTDLTGLGWLEQRGPAAARGGFGRPAAHHRLRPGLGMVAAVDISVHHVSGMIADLQGTELVSHREPVSEDATAETRLAVAVALILELCAQAGGDVKDLWMVGAGSPGAIDLGRVTYFGGEGMPGWAGTDIGAELAGRLHRPVFVEGDSALGALAEQWKGAASAVNDVVFLLSGERTGAAAVVGGRLHRGAHGGAGLVGELSELRWQELEHEQYGAKDLPEPRPPREAIFAAARRNDAAAEAAVLDFARALALGASAMVLALDPEMLVIGGPSAQYADLVVPSFSAELALHCPWVPVIAASELGGKAVLVGSVRQCIAELRETLMRAVDDDASFPAPGSGLVCGRIRP